MPFNTTKRLLTPEEMTTKMVTRAQAAGGDWQSGALNPRKNPVTEMKKSGTKFANAMQAAIQNKSYDKGVASINEEDMVAAIQSAGPSAYTNGVNRKQGKILAANVALAAKRQSAIQVLDAMPTDTQAQREAKMLKNLELQRGMKLTK